MSGRRRGPMGHGGHGMPGEKAKDFRGTMKKLMVNICDREYHFQYRRS